MKHTLKQLLQTLGTLRALMHRLCYALMARLLDRQRAFSLASERLARLPGLTGLHTRAAFYRAVTDHVGVDVHFGFMSLLSKPDITIGDRVYIGRFCTLGRVDIDVDVMIADGVQVLSGRHQHGRTVTPGQTLRDNEQSFAKITLGRGAWIGANAVVMADVGEGAVVAAGAVVVRPVPAGARVAGVPARVMQQRASDAA